MCVGMYGAKLSQHPLFQAQSAFEPALHATTHGTLVYAGGKNNRGTTAAACKQQPHLQHCVAGITLDTLPAFLNINRDQAGCLLKPAWCGLAMPPAVEDAQLPVSVLPVHATFCMTSGIKTMLNHVSL